MSVRHHPHDAILLAYATRALPEALSLMVACHVAICDRSRETVARFEALGGVVLEATDAAEMAPDSLRNVLDQLDMEPDKEIPPKRPNDVLPAPLQDHLGCGLEGLSWRDAGAGLREVSIDTDDAVTARLLWATEGAALPDLREDRVEMTLVLDGTYKTGGQVFTRGDVDIGAGEHGLKSRVEESGPCLCMRVTQTPQSLQDLAPDIARQFVRV